jgi:outer membrane protein assembly factor BamB
MNKAIFIFLLLVLSGCTNPAGNFNYSGNYTNGNNQPFENNPANDIGGDQAHGIMNDLVLGSVPVPPISGENMTVNLGELKITYYSAVISYPDLLPGSDILIHVKNNGNTASIVFVNSTRPSNALQYLRFNNGSVTINAKEEEIIHYFSSDDSSALNNLTFALWTESDASDAVYFNISIYAGEPIDRSLAPSSRIQGYVHDINGNPLGSVRLEFYIYSGRISFSALTDSFGFYYADVPGVDDLKKYLGDEEILYNSFDYFVIINDDNYSYYYNDGFDANRNETISENFTLSPKIYSSPYSLDWEFNASEYYGFWKLHADNDWNTVLATQAKHDPQLGFPANFYLLNISNGAKLWNFSAGDQCWGSDLTLDGSIAAVGCHDNNAYAINASTGNLMWNYTSRNINRALAISSNNKYLVTGPVEAGDYGLFNLSTGELLMSFNSETREWLRTVIFSPDSSKFFVSLSSGELAAYDVITGARLWDYYTGEFFLFMTADNNGNLYGSGKDRILYSFDSSGNIRWSFREPDHLSGAGDVSSDGSLVVIGSVGAWVYGINGASGEVLWRRRVNGENVGHNAVSVSSDGSFAAVGSAPDNTIYLFDRNGNMIFENTVIANTDPILNLKWEGIGTNSSPGTQKGVMCTLVSTNASRIIVAYGDDYVRSFVRQ